MALEMDLEFSGSLIAFRVRLSISSGIQKLNRLDEIRIGLNVYDYIGIC
jgi:hypothetical protein